MNIYNQVNSRAIFLNLLLGAILSLLSFTSSHSQQYNFRNYSIEQGLSQSQVYAICEDNHGNIWLGTRGGGLSRFDGINFSNYTVQEGLASNYINSIIKDKSGYLWIGTDNGLSKYDGHQFQNYQSDNGLYNSHINDLLMDKDGTLWIATHKGLFQLSNDTIVRFGRKLGIPMEKITSVEQDVSGVVWAGSDFGIFKLMKSKGNWEMAQLTKKDGLPNNQVTAITPIAKGGIWVCTYGGGVAKVNGRTIDIINQKNGLISNTVFSCLTDGSGVTWFGTAYGLNKYQLNAGDSIPLMSSVTEAEGLPNNVIMSIMKDSFGNTWFGTSGGGVSKLDSDRFIHYTGIKGVVGSWTYSIFQDSKGQMWFGTSEGGVTSYDGSYYKRYSDRHGFTSSKVKCIYEEKDGIMWFGTIGDGLYRYDGKYFKHYNHKNGLSSEFINSIVADSLGRIWIATAGGGINCLTPDKNNTFKIRIIKPKDGLSTDRINVLAMDDKGNIWVGGINGVIGKINYSVEEDKIYIKNYSTNTSGIRSIIFDKRGVMFLGTVDAGIIMYDRNHFHSWSKENGLSSNNVYSIIIDNEENLWVGTEKGIDKISFTDDLKIKVVRHYGKSEGFTGIETIHNAVCKDRAGRLWFGSVKSATVYDPLKETEYKLPNTILTGINLFFDKIENTIYGKEAFAWYPVPVSLDLPYDQNHLSFEFIGIEQSNPEAVRYQWMLEGFDDSWSPVTHRREAVYSNLPPGNYMFKVKAANEQKRWTDPVTYSFTIHPPYWQTWWFRILTVSIAFVFISLIITYAIRKVKADNERERQKLEAEKTLIELEQKALRLQMNPHFLFNCLNSIKGLISENKPEEAKIYLSRFAKLMRSMLDNSREPFISLETEIASLYNYAELEKLSRDDKFTFSIQTDKNIDPTFVQIPPMLIQPFVENSIIHGIAPKEDKGRVSVNFSIDGDYLKCTIEDDGIGRKKAEEMKSKSMDQHRSAALTVIQDRLNIIYKKLNLGEVKVQIDDVVLDCLVVGTKVELLIPYQYL